MSKENESIMPCDNIEVLSELDLEDPPEELIEYAKRELGEDPETRCQVLEEFRDLIYERGECTPHRTDDAYLLRFLRTKNFIVRQAHRLLVNYYELKENNPDFYDGVNLKQLEKVGQKKLLTVPPYREQTGRRMLLYRLGHWSPDNVSVTEILQATMIILELAILEQRAQILGGICIFDLGGLTMQQVLYMTPNLAKTIFQVMVTSFPLRIHAVHIINQPWVFEVVFNLFKPFLNQKMKERVFVHGDDMESLHKHIDPKSLPEIYGGIHPDYNYGDWIRYFEKTKKIIWELKTLDYAVEHVPSDNEDSK